MLQTPADPLHRSLMGPKVFIGWLTCVCTSGHVCLQVCVCVGLHTFTWLTEGRIFFIDVAVVWCPARNWSQICSRTGCEMIISHVGRVRHFHASLFRYRRWVHFLNWICLFFSAKARAQCLGPQCHMVGRATDQHTPGLESLACSCCSGSSFLFPDPDTPSSWALLIMINCNYHDQLWFFSLDQNSWPGQEPAPVKYGWCHLSDNWIKSSHPIRTHLSSLKKCALQKNKGTILKIHSFIHNN